MQNKITPFLTFNDQAEEAATLYTSIFKNSKILGKMPGPGGKVMSVTFEIEGQRVMTLNGGPTFGFSEGFSMFVSCETQEEIDEYWSKLTADGGSEGRCGWCKDKFGVSWQIIPTVLGQLFSDPDRERANRGIQAMMGMNKLDIAGLKRAADGK
jgi:predicted 3-demethylubiquinone-9 3-methyltransferase (glyoxalase superfamily)